MGNRPVGTSTREPVSDRGTSALVASRAPADRTHNYQQEFDSVYAALHAELANAGFTGAVEGSTRARYDRLVKKFRDDIYDSVRKGRMTWKDAAAEARLIRDEVMQLCRSRSTPVGRALAEFLKPESPTLNQLVAKKTIELYGKEANFTKLAVRQQNRVYAAIVESSGKPNALVNKKVRLASRAGKALLFVSVGISLYVVATAEDKVEAAKQEGAVTGAGIAGGIAGGALAGLACGPGAPVCVTIGAFVGGAVAAFGVDAMFWQ
jgi:hypothetical protein